MIFESDENYGAELDLPFPAGAWAGAARSKLTDAGFAHVGVYKASDGKWYATGTWTGATVDIPLPEHVVRAWKTAK